MWQGLRKYQTDKAMEYMVVHQQEHDYFNKRISELRTEWQKATISRRPVDASLKERLSSLSDIIGFQINQDDLKTFWFPRDTQDMISWRHFEWEGIQREIKVMIDPDLYS